MKDINFYLGCRKRVRVRYNPSKRCFESKSTEDPPQIWTYTEPTEELKQELIQTILRSTR